MLKSLLLWAGIFLCSLLGLLWGILTMFSPRTLQRFMEWYTRADTWSTAKGPSPAKGRVSDRFAGFLAVLMAGWMAFHSAARLLRYDASVGGPVQAPAPPPVGRHWPTLVGAIIWIGLGILGCLRPMIAPNMTKANFPNRELSDEAVRRALQGGRALGVLSIIVGAFLLVLWYRSAY